MWCFERTTSHMISLDIGAREPEQSEKGWDELRGFWHKGKKNKKQRAQLKSISKVI